MKRLAPLLAGLIAFSSLSACSFGGPGPRTYQAEFSRAVQVFPAVKVRVLGVDVGVVTDVRNVRDGVQVTFRVDDPKVKLPADVGAAVVPMSLLGERYIQLVPAYTNGPTLPGGSTIPTARTAVPAEPDELLRSLQDYLGGIDPKNVTALVQNAASLVEGKGQDLNRLIEHGAGVISALSQKRDDLAHMIVELNKLTLALSTRQEAIARLIQNYGAVTGTLDDNRAALEGTITGLNDAAAQLASLLVAHRNPLRKDIETLATAGRTLDRNAEALSLTTKWATRLFRAASRAVDFNHNWLRLSNQGQELGAFILIRLQQRLQDLCKQAGVVKCQVPGFWERKVPSLFCFQDVCPMSVNKTRDPGTQLMFALQSQPEMKDYLARQARARDVDLLSLIDLLLRQTLGNPFSWWGVR
jgi:phospholipid/cholesterol/gamma-HCH transport system substrate-binding protein